MRNLHKHNNKTDRYVIFAVNHLSYVCLWLAIRISKAISIFVVDTTNKNMTSKQKLNATTDGVARLKKSWKYSLNSLVHKHKFLQMEKHTTINMWKPENKNSTLTALNI